MKIFLKFKSIIKRKIKKETLLWKIIVRVYGLSEKFKIRLIWFLKLKLRNLLSDRIKVGFGPITTGENTLGARKWHIDPIINYINKYDKKYVANIFFDKDDLTKFDVIVIVKSFDNLSNNMLKKLKEKNILLVYDIIDNPLG
ncbi:hypothetical protein KY342_03460, partial [Candidatus Woesearchaeota archaeon]|nr:hypothetical protein [Candidatus Woesearchaeota archaeon]